MSVKEIFLTTEYEDEKWLGKFADETCYDVLLQEDCDVYKPCRTPGMDPRDESLVLVKFRKGVFSKELTDAAYEALLPGATGTNNRGIAAGPRGNPGGNQKWVTRYQKAVLDFYAKGGMKTSITTLEEVKKDVERLNAIEPEDQLNHGNVWLVGKTKEENFVFEEWETKAETMESSEAAAEAKKILTTMIQNTARAAEVKSGVGGFFDRYPRIPYCRATSFTANNFEQFKKSYPFIEAVAEQFRQTLPGRYDNQLKACQSIDKEFVIGTSVFTTMTINQMAGKEDNKWRTACHRDAGDLESGFGNIVALGNGIEWQGCNLVFPKYRVAVDLRTGDYLAFSPHDVHGNTEHNGPDGYDRMSLVLYFREKMLECGSKFYEDLRYKFVEERRMNTSHPEWKLKWNGITPGMWESEEWVLYVINNGGHQLAEDYHPDFFRKSEELNLDDFF